MEPLSLDELFAEVRPHLNAQRIEAARLAKLPKHLKPKDLPPPPAELFARAENWTRTRGVALIHEETQTLLGNFSEFIHKSVAGARKLVREESLLSVIAATETVSGDWWIAAKREIAAPEVWHEKRQAVLHLLFPALGVHSPGCPLTVHLSYGGITRVELDELTQFAQIEGGVEQLLWLPAGVNVLPEMSRDCKIALRIEIKL